MKNKKYLIRFGVLDEQGEDLDVDSDIISAYSLKDASNAARLAARELGKFAALGGHEIHSLFYSAGEV
jgi:hypothetical protein